MYEFYKGQTVKTVIGKTLTAEELRERPFFAPLFEDECVIVLNSDGRMTSFKTLSEAKADLGIPVDDGTTGDDAARLLNEAQAEVDRKAAEAEAQAKEEQATLADIQAQLDALTGAN
ncbi:MULTISPECIES: hypothetical protein [Gordonibacter]|uniref:Uncharacterized protein n=1 Tax=Gordonibacter faecis TaxID=3047475 RepID=A0ABT7DU30_9ACTN|nr:MULTISPECIES: hypothetical protein [unclassified Gordonibacter]MDJ1651620.1 hypothetical protein [Gordonibacter sp. KGMB12511]HIW77042.1 hypothetical protein [Candidatus Gordonibacter avicola]